MSGFRHEDPRQGKLRGRTLHQRAKIGHSVFVGMFAASEGGGKPTHGKMNSTMRFNRQWQILVSTRKNGVTPQGCLHEMDAGLCAYITRVQMSMSGTSARSIGTERLQAG